VEDYLAARTEASRTDPDGVPVGYEPGQAQAWAWRCPLGASDPIMRLVLLALAHESDGWGFTVVAQSRVARMASAARNTAQAKMKLLAEAGWVETFEPARQSRPSLCWIRVHESWSATELVSALLASTDAEHRDYAMDLSERYPSLHACRATESVARRKGLGLDLGPVLPGLEPKAEGPRTVIGRKPNCVWDAIVETTNASVAQRGQVSRTQRDIREEMRGASDAEIAAEIRVRAARWPYLYPRATLTARALAAHWRVLGQPQPQEERDRIVHALVFPETS
jgi:hypothetical protein